MIDYDSDEAALIGAVERFARERLAPAADGLAASHAFPVDLVREFGALGYMGVAYDAAYEGVGLGVRGSAIVAEILARTEPSFAAIFLCNCAPASLLASFGSEDLKREWLVPLCRGEALASFGVTEPHGGSDVANIRTRAERDGDEWIINGSKVFSTNAGTALHRLSTIVAVTDPEDASRRLSTFVVPVGTKGFSVGRPARKIGWCFADSVELYFDGVRIPDRYRIGGTGDGLRQVLSVLGSGRVLVAAAALGLARKAIDLVKAYGRDRILFGQSILAQPGLAFPLADILTKIHAAELMVRNAACLSDRGTPSRNASAMAKLFASELAVEAALKAIQAHGGYGVFEDSPVSRLLGEAKVLEIVEGTSEIQRMLISRELLT